MLTDLDLTVEWLLTLSEQIEQDLRWTDVPLDQWRVGGRATKANPNKEDLAFWRDEGLRQVQAYIDWMERSGWSFAVMPDGKPGIEWEAEVPFGGRPVRLIVDAIYQVGDDWIVVDYKTGSRTPAGVLQLALYASAIERIYGKRPKYGAFYMTRKAELSELTNLDSWGMDYFDYVYTDMNERIDRGLFPPVIGDHCNWCSVSEYCVAVRGSLSTDYPLAQPKENR